MISVDNLVITYGEGPRAVQAVKGVSFEVAEGESFGLVGESGSGKSTILRVLSGLNQIWDGTIRIAGTPLPRKPDRAFFKRVQMVFQDPYGSLHPRHTVDRVLSEPIAVHGLPDGQDRVVQALRDVGLDPVKFRFRYPHQLSGGQRQRVAIARALVLEPRVLLLDEPTSALDVSVQAEILNLLRRLRAERGMTYILVSHNLSVVANMCDRLAIMNNGRIVEQVSSDLLARRALTQPYSQQLLTASLGFDRAAADQFKTFA